MSLCNKMKSSLLDGLKYGECYFDDNKSHEVSDGVPSTKIYCSSDIGTSWMFFMKTL